MSSHYSWRGHSQRHTYIHILRAHTHTHTMVSTLFSCTKCIFMALVSSMCSVVGLNQKPQKCKFSFLITQPHLPYPNDILMQLTYFLYEPITTSTTITSCNSNCWGFNKLCQNSFRHRFSSKSIENYVIGAGVVVW